MGNIERMTELHEKEKEALKKYEQTNDIRYLNHIKRCIEERLQLMTMRTAAFTPSLKVQNEKKR